MRIAKLKLLGEVYDEIHADAVDAVSAREDSEHLNTP
jgi:hypothetical protein